MRWLKKVKYVPILGDIRIVKKFLWLPKTIQGETRWLEYTSIVQRRDWVTAMKGYVLRYSESKIDWVDVEWRV